MILHSHIAAAYRHPSHCLLTRFNRSSAAFAFRRYFRSFSRAATSQIRIVEFENPEANPAPSGENATDATTP
jgi:hypothetical protein